MISAEQTKKLATGLIEIFKTPAVTNSQTEAGACERISVTVPTLNRDKLLRLANLAINNPEEIEIKRSGQKIHIGFIPGNKKVSDIPAKPFKPLVTRRDFFEAMTSDVKKLAYENARPDTNWDEEVIYMTTAIEGAFNVDDTPQGFRYWFEVAKEFNI